MSGVSAPSRASLLDEITVRAEADTERIDLAAPGAAKAAARAELGLPIDRPIVMVGHQAEVWHAGILAKLIAADQIAKDRGASLVWLTPDQDDNEPTMLAYPAETHEGRLKRREWLIDPNAFVRRGTPTGSRTAMEAGVVPRVARTEWPHERVRDGLSRIREALVARQGEASLAMQFTGAALDLVRDALGIQVDHVLSCSGMARGSAFGMWAERMQRDAKDCVLAYNSAAQAAPEAHVRELGMGPQWELPFWALTPDRPRVPVHASEELPSRFAPRALAMSGFARTLLCDAWVMGTGGEAYDAGTRQWLSTWMGRSDLAPGVIASATLRLSLREGPLPDPAKAARAAWQAHHARHHPGLLGRDDLQRTRDELVAELQRAPRRSNSRRELFASLREVVHAAQREEVDSLEGLDDVASAERERLRDKDCLLDRTWPFALHDRSSLQELDAAVRSGVGALA